MHWLPLTLICALALASADAATKRLLAGYPAIDMLAVRLVWAALLLAPLLLLVPWPQLSWSFWGWVAALLPFDVVAMLLYMRAIRDSPLAHTLPYLAFTPVFNVATAWLLLGERVSATGLIGILVVTAGAYALNIDRVDDNGRRSWLAPLKFIVRERGPRLMLSVAIIYSLTSTLAKGAIAHVPAAFFGPFYFLILAAFMLAVVMIRAPRGWLPLLVRRPAAHLTVGIAMAVMVYTHFLAMQDVAVAYMIAVKRSSLLFGILYGALLFGEQRLLQHLTGGAIMVAGIALIAFSG
jgi:drug/metabolite transporter (DMT)-like permease